MNEKKKRTSRKRIIGAGALCCFDFYDYYKANPDDDSFGWTTGNDKMISLTKETVEYIEENDLSIDDFNSNFEELLEDEHFLKLSILGNKIEYEALKDYSEEELESHFEGSEDYYTPEDLMEVIDYLESKI